MITPPKSRGSFRASRRAACLPRSRGGPCPPAAGRLCYFCVDLGPRLRCVRHRGSVSSFVLAGERAGTLTWTWRPEKDSNPSTYRLGGRFVDTCQLPLAWPEPVCLVSGYTPMSTVPAPFWHRAGTGRPSALVTLWCKYARTVSNLRSSGVEVSQAAVGIGSCRLSLWSALRLRSDSITADDPVLT
jgi:hypothetical protein